VRSKRISGRCGETFRGTIADALSRCGHSFHHLVPISRRSLIDEAADALDAATSAGEFIHVPSICIVELTYLVEKGRLPSAARDRLIQALDDPATPCLLAPLDRSVLDALESVSRGEVPDMPDRIVTATALALRVPLISRDWKIRATRIQTIW